MTIRMDFESLEEGGVPSQQDLRVDELLSFYENDLNVYSHDFGVYFRESIEGIIPRTLEKLRGRVSPEMIQGFVDRASSLFSTDGTSPLSAYFSALLMACPDVDIAIDVTDSHFKSDLGILLEGKVLRIIGDPGAFFGTRAKNCEFYGGVFGEFTGAGAEGCTFVGEVFNGALGGAIKSVFRAELFNNNYQGVGHKSVGCRFYSQVPFKKISQEQDGSSCYFVCGVEIGYDHYVEGDCLKRLTRHEP